MTKEPMLIEADDQVTCLARPVADVEHRLAAAVSRLYSEDRMNGNAMRDMAQSLAVLLDEVREYQKEVS